MCTSMYTAIGIRSEPVMPPLSRFEYNIDSGTYPGMSWPAFFRPQNCPFTSGDVDHHLIRGSLRSLESTFQTASRSVQPCLHSSRSRQTGRQNAAIEGDSDVTCSCHNYASFFRHHVGKLCKNVCYYNTCFLDIIRTFS